MGRGLRAQSLFILNTVENACQFVRENNLHLSHIRGLGGSSWASGTRDAQGRGVGAVTTRKLNES